jgi:ATP-dependent Lon protease
LLDRTEVITIDGYTDAEKVEIARDHLLPRQLRGAGLEPEELEVTEGALATIVDRYTREAGVRNLERQLGKLARKVATEIAKSAEATTVEIDDADLREYLGRPKVWKDEAKDRTDVPGVATGLAVTGAGGDVLFIEATSKAGERDLVLTGQLGDVMKESARIALSYLESRADELKIEEATLNRSYHLHVPAGAVPKDGPSAGITMATALASLMTGRKVRGDIGMTGEVTLQGKVLPIGGVKQKVLAAHRAGLTQVIVPRRNEADIDDVPELVRDEMTFHIADDMTQVLEWALI